MSEHSSEAERVDESAVGAGGETSYEADVAASGSPSSTAGPDEFDSQSADEKVENSHAADVDAGYDDPANSPTIVSDPQQEDGTF